MLVGIVDLHFERRCVVVGNLTSGLVRNIILTIYHPCGKYGNGSYGLLTH